MSAAGSAQKSTPGGTLDEDETKRGLRNVWLDDLDRSNLPVIQRDSLRRIGSHANADGGNSFPSYTTIGDEIGGATERSVRYALKGRPDRGMSPVIGVWVDVVKQSKGPGQPQVYQLLSRDERLRRLADTGTPTVPPFSGEIPEPDEGAIPEPNGSNTGTNRANTGTTVVPPSDPKSDPSTSGPSLSDPNRSDDVNRTDKDTSQSDAAWAAAKAVYERGELEAQIAETNRVNDEHEAELQRLITSAPSFDD